VELSFDDLYADVPADQREALRAFRQSERQAEIELDGRRWRYVASGHGPKTVVFLPGGFARADIWLRPVLALEREYKVLAVDASLEVFDAKRFCDAVLAIADHEGVDRFTAVGTSYGGGLVQYLLAHHSHRLDHAVLSHCTAVTPRIATLMRRIRRAVGLIPAFLINAALHRRRRPLAYDSPYPGFTTAYMRELSGPVDKNVLRRFLDQTIETIPTFRHDPSALAAWPGRILILTSNDDRTSFPRLNELTERYPRAEVHVFDEGGHATVLLFPDRVSDVLGAFLSRA
jgi:pimeloyl-ACP methyl ester carboxylesterase